MTMISKSDVQGRFLMQGESEIGNVEVDTEKNNNETKMSDNEAFMAYMSKAEAGEDDDE